MHERDARILDAPARRLVEHPHALRLQLADGRLDVVHLDGEVLEPRAALLDVARDGAVG